MYKNTYTGYSEKLNIHLGLDKNVNFNIYQFQQFRTADKKFWTSANWNILKGYFIVIIITRVKCQTKSMSLEADIIRHIYCTYKK